jgi:hypothetical protein
MPRVKPLIEKRGSSLARLLWGQMAVNDVSLGDVAQKMNMGVNTLRRRKEDPESLTVGELLKMGKLLNIPIEDLRQSIRY